MTDGIVDPVTLVAGTGYLLCGPMVSGRATLLDGQVRTLDVIDAIAEEVTDGEGVGGTSGPSIGHISPHGCRRRVALRRL